MTNGEKIREVFPDIKMLGESKDTLDYSLGGMIHRAIKSWWNAEYKERGRKMKKIFISQPMNGLSDLQIKKDRERVIEGLYEFGYKPDEITIMDTSVKGKENAPDNVNSSLWYLGKSLELLADADIVVFAKGWRNARGCQIEFKCAKEYKISYICED